MADARDTQDEPDREPRASEERERERAEERGFKVEDRRRFTAEGQARTEPDANDTAAEAKARGQGAPQPHADSSDPGVDQRSAAPELSFTSFVIGIASQAFVFLGVMPDPQGGAVGKDLSQAKAMIDILSMLSEKTRGNLDEQEAHMMSEMLYELRMLYVKELRGGPTGGKS